MSTRSSAESSASAPSITIEEAFAYCRAHPVDGVDLERLLGIFVSGAHCILDARDHGLLGIVMDRLTIADGAKPFEWIGGPTVKVHPESSLELIRRLRIVGRRVGVSAIDITLQDAWSEVRAQLSEQGARPRYVDVEMTCFEEELRNPKTLPVGWRWVWVVPDYEHEYYSLLMRSLAPMPGVYVPPITEAIASMRTTNARILLDETRRARALVRCKTEDRYIHLLARCPEMKGRGLGTLALDEAQRLLGPGQMHLSVVKQNRFAHSFYERNGFQGMEEVETWQLPVLR
jgi:hypothetical protein